MAVRYQDYYEILGLSRSAGQDEIKKAYRKLARRYHPDVNKSRDAEDKFKQIGEAYEVLGDPENRRKYDALGSNWRMGQEFSPPPRDGRDNVRYEFSGEGAGDFTDGRGFSDFFETLFANMGRQSGFERAGAAGRRSGSGADHEAEITISLEDAYHGGNKAVSFQTTEADGKGGVHRGVRDYSIHVPTGIAEGSRIRLAGQGGKGLGTGRPGDLYLRVHIAPHPTFRLQGRNLEINLPVTPWEAALGAKVSLLTLDGRATLSIPAGTQSGQRIRLRGKGMPAMGPREAGDLIVTAQVSIPTNLTSRERDLFERLAKTSEFNPRQ